MLGGICQNGELDCLRIQKQAFFHLSFIQSYNTQYEAFFITPNQSKVVSDPIDEHCTRGGHIVLPELKLKEPGQTMISKSRREAVIEF